MIMNDQLSGNVDKETYQFSLLFLILKKCSLNLVLRARLVCQTCCIPQPPSLQVRTYITSSNFQSKSELFTTENCLWLTEEIIADWQIKCLQQMQLLALHLEILGYILFLLYGFSYFRNVGDLIGESLILRWLPLIKKQYSYRLL